MAGDVGSWAVVSELMNVSKADISRKPCTACATRRRALDNVVPIDL